MRARERSGLRRRGARRFDRLVRRSRKRETGMTLRFQLRRESSETTRLGLESGGTGLGKRRCVRAVDLVFVFIAVIFAERRRCENGQALLPDRRGERLSGTNGLAQPHRGWRGKLEDSRELTNRCDDRARNRRVFADVFVERGSSGRGDWRVCGCVRPSGSRRDFCSGRKTVPARGRPR